MTSTISVVWDFVEDTMTVVSRVNPKRHEVIEEIEVPENEDAEEYAEVLRNEAYLGEQTETRTRY